MKTKLVVCGDSFHSISNQTSEIDPTINYVGTHWSELLSNKLDWDLANLSMPGASNATIVLQILEAIDSIHPDFIIVGWSAGHGTRIECCTDNKKINEKIHLGHFQYLCREHPYIKLKKENDINIFLKSTNLSYSENIPLRNTYVEHLQNFFVGQKDEWMVIYSVIKLVESKIPFLIFELPPTWTEKQTTPWTKDFLKYMDEKNLIFSKDFNPYKNYKKWEYQTPVYHSSPEDQILIAEYLENRIKDQFNVKI